MYIRFRGAASALLILFSACLRGSSAQETTSVNDTSAGTPVVGAQNAIPTVDLGYSLYRPTAVNTTGQYYNFSNIRFAAPPVGDLRWRAPSAPLTDRNTINDGSLGYICPQAPPFWFAQAMTALGDLSTVIPPSAPGQTESEDCLFLDVITPIPVFQQGQRRGGKLAPVLVNIHGGGFWIGDKTTLYPPNGLLTAASNEIVYVSMNYRLAAFGFLSGLEQAGANLTKPNAGLLDQRAALKWVQQNIHLFGGDPRQVTITGESAGGASVQYHTVAYGGRKENDLFIRGISQSPAPLASDPIYASIGANLFLQSAGVSTADEARKLPSTVLQAANKAAQANTPFNVDYFGPVVDGDLLLDILPRSYTKGEYIKNLDIITSHNEDEARFLGSQTIATNADFNKWVRVNFPSAPIAVQNQIINQIYPPRYDGSLPYVTPQQRSDLAVKEYLISCNTISIAYAYQHKTYNYIFGISPAIHAQDLAYTYYPNTPSTGFYPQIAMDMQGYFTQFTLAGDPNKRGLPQWPQFGQGAKAINFTVAGIQDVVSDAANSRCAFWNEATYFP